MSVSRGYMRAQYLLLMAFTITCPNITFHEVTTCIHKSNARTETPTFWKVAATWPPTNECFVAYVNPLLVYHHLRFKPPEDGLHMYHASCGA